MSKIKVGIIMGSDSDFPVMEKALAVFDEAGISYEVRIISAHRTPEEMLNYAKGAKERGYSIIIAGAGGSAHLPGMVASMCSLPVIGVPVRTRAMAGIESVLSILQMPAGIPVATVGINNAAGAAKLAVRMIKADKGNVRILSDEDEVTKEDLAKTTETLEFYGLDYDIVGYGTSDNNGTTAVLNLSSIALDKVSAATTAPVLSVPLKTKSEQPNEFKQAIVTVEEVCKECDEMEKSASPVAMLAVNGYQNAGIMLARMAGVHDEEIYKSVADKLASLRKEVMAKDAVMVEKF